MDRIAMVSSDGHAGVLLAAYRPYLEKRYLADFDDYERSLKVFWQETKPMPAVAAERNAVAKRCRFMDSKGRLEDLEQNGVVSEVLFPGASPETNPPWSDFLSSGSFRGRTAPQRELQGAGERAYNRWLAEFCQDAPKDRRLGLALIPFWDVQSAVREIHWAADQDLRGVTLPFFNYDVPEYCHGWHWDPIWRACEERRMSVNFHGGYGTTETGPHEVLLGLEHMFYCKRVIGHLLLSGVFDRFPKLQAAMTESMAGWVPPALAEMDVLYDANEAAADNPVLFADPNLPERRPSEYWGGENFFVGVSVANSQEMALRHQIGVDSMMYGIDYPHPEGPWGQAETWMQATLGRAGVSETEARKILGENAARLYRVDLEALAPVIERIGPRIEDVLHDASAAQMGALMSEMSATGRGLAVQQYGLVEKQTA